jgi:hypothetical protein
MTLFQGFFLAALIAPPTVALVMLLITPFVRHGRRTDAATPAAPASVEHPHAA